MEKRSVCGGFTHLPEETPRKEGRFVTCEIPQVTFWMLVLVGVVVIGETKWGHAHESFVPKCRKWLVDTWSGVARETNH